MDNNNYTPSEIPNRREYLQLNNLFLSVFHSMPLSVNILNSKQEIVMCNEPAYKIFGCKTEDEYFAKFKDLSPLYQPDGILSAEKFVQLSEDTYRDGRTVFDWTHCDVHGNLIPFNIILVTLDIIDEYDGNLLVGYLEDMRPSLLQREMESQLNKKTKALLDAAPLCHNIWTRDFKITMCNKQAYQMFDLESEEQYLNEFYNLSPEYQPNGRKSTELVQEFIQKAFDTGYCKFKWLHLNLKGDEIPTEVTLVKIDAKDSGDGDLVAAYARDLRDSLAGNASYSDDQEDTYFFNHITDRALFHSISQLSDELFFSFDIRTSFIQYFGKMSNLLGIENNQDLFPDIVVNEKMVYEEDIPFLLKMIENIRNGICAPFDIRFKGVKGNYHYFRFIYQVIFSGENEPIFAVGKAIDIQEQKELELKAKTDLLTSCFNKITTEMEISNIFESSKENQEHLLFIIDIDDFKNVNDNLGHHFGDLVLIEVANKLKVNFRNQDIVGRIGGDEFIVLAKDISDMNIAIKKAEDISNSFYNTYSNENKEYKISASIGIARYPSDGKTYNDLYKAADKALYESKRSGKNCYTFYSDKLLDGTMNNLTAYENASRNANKYFDADLIAIVFDLLYSSNNIRTSINSVLQHLGERLSVDRCYLFESFDNGNIYDNTYEWCNPGINPEIDNLKGLSKEILADFFSDASSDGILYSNDLNVLTAEGAYKLMADQDIKSFLHAQTINNGFVKEFLGVDDCTNPRIWRENEINSISYVRKIVSIFLLIENSNLN